MNSTVSMAEQPVYSHSLKLEEIAKSLRIGIHVYANSGGEAIEEVFNTYLKAKITAIDNKILLPPVENIQGRSNLCYEVRTCCTKFHISWFS
jgi:hypothetical protein